MDLQLRDKVVIVTGGAKGIGAGIVQACAAEGAIPVIVGRDPEAGEHIQSDIQKQGGRCELITGASAVISIWMAFDGPPPGNGFSTVTGCRPSGTGGVIAADSCVADANVVGNDAQVA